MTKVLGFLIVVGFFMASGARSLLACTCLPDDPDRANLTVEEIRKEKREYFLNKFEGAAFIGRILKRDRVQMYAGAVDDSGKPIRSQEYKYTILVSEYWLGVASRTMIVYGEPPYAWSPGGGLYGSSCGFKKEVGKTYFFTPSVFQKNLTISMCDYAGTGSSPKGSSAIEFRKIMGEPKRF